ncbi:hypothetical protein, partial [Pseudoalteromonas sp. APC 3694]|uniref:hypothetical protein n=1 Tax=Pseudoalteromonas sp. APC 3694 TaxID=3035202 RepID=UPI0025B2C1D9
LSVHDKTGIGVHHHRNTQALYGVCLTLLKPEGRAINQYKLKTTAQVGLSLSFKECIQYKAIKHFISNFVCCQVIKHCQKLIFKWLYLF